MRIHLLEAEMFHADGQTDMSKLTEAFRNFTKEPKNNLFISVRTTPPPKKNEINYFQIRLTFFRH